MIFNCAWPDLTHVISFAMRVNNIDLTDDSGFNLINVPGKIPINQPMGTSNHSVTVKSGIVNDTDGTLIPKIMSLVASTHMVEFADDPVTGNVPLAISPAIIPIWYFQKKEIIQRRGYITQWEISLTFTEPGEEFYGD